MTRFCFLIRTLNEAKFLRHTLERIFGQGHSGEDFNIDVTVVDSGSTDQTLQIAEEFGCKVVVVPQEEWSWGKALNIGFENCQAEFVGIISAHCYLIGDSFVVKAVSLMREHGLDALYGRQVAISGMDVFEEYELNAWYPKEGLRKLTLSDLGGVSNACCIMRRSAWQNLPFDEEAQSMEDGIWAVNALRAGRTIAYSSEIELYHSHPFDPSYIYRKWFSRTLEGLRFGDRLWGAQRAFQAKKCLKRMLSPAHIFTKSIKDAWQLKSFLVRQNVQVCNADIFRFILLKWFAVFNAHRTYMRGERVSYWRVSMSGFLIRLSNSFDYVGHVSV